MRPPHTINTMVFVKRSAFTGEYTFHLREYNRTWGSIHGHRLRAFYSDTIYDFVRYYEENKAAIRMIILDAWPANRIVIRFLAMSLRMRTPSLWWPPIIVNTHMMAGEGADGFPGGEPFLSEKIHGPLTYVDSTVLSPRDKPNSLSWALYDNIKRPKGI